MFRATYVRTVWLYPLSFPDIQRTLACDAYFASEVPVGTLWRSGGVKLFFACTARIADVWSDR